MARETSCKEDEWFKKNERQMLEDNRRQREKTLAT
jgi:hypothetical protein